MYIYVRMTSDLICDSHENVLANNNDDKLNTNTIFLKEIQVVLNARIKKLVNKECCVV